MELQTIIILLIITFIFAIVYVLIRRNSRQKEAKFLQSLAERAEMQGGKITRHERWNNSIIGIDDQANSIFVISKRGEQDEFQQIELTEFQKCRVYESNRIVNNNESNTKVVDKIEMIFSSTDKNRADAIVTFYNTDHDSLYLKNELQLAEKWCSIANEKIKSSVR